MMKNPAIYIMSTKRNGTLYVGVTSNLPRRVYEHREGLIDGFTKGYGCKFLMYYESHGAMESAIFREKQIKSWVRKKKLNLIEGLNPQWNDLYSQLGI